MHLYNLSLRSVGLILILLLGLVACQDADSDSGEADLNSQQKAEKTFINETQLQLPKEFQAIQVVDSIGRPRHLAVDAEGDIYTILLKKGEQGGLVAMRDVDGDSKADSIVYFGDYQGTGLAIWKDYLYFSTDTSIHRYALKAGDLAPQGEAETVLSGFNYETQHAAKTFTFDLEGNMYVNIGAPSNACQEEDRVKGSPGQNPCPLLEEYGGIWRFKADQLGQIAYQDGERYATGIRNGMALDWNTNANQLYVLQHGRDQLSQFFPDLYSQESSAELPSEEFFKVAEGDDFGWPYCYYDHIQKKKLLGPEFGGDAQTVGRCEGVKAPIMGFPGHYAPNDLIFYQGEQFPEKYRQGAFIAFHGSWNRAPGIQEGYHVVFVPFEGDLPSGDWEVFADNFSGKTDLKSPRNADHRPTGLAIGPDGSLYVADDRNGSIFKIIYRANAKVQSAQLLK